MPWPRSLDMLGDEYRSFDIDFTEDLGLGVFLDTIQEQSVKIPQQHNRILAWTLMRYTHRDKNGQLRSEKRLII